MLGQATLTMSVTVDIARAPQSRSSYHFPILSVLHFSNARTRLRAKADLFKSSTHDMNFTQ